MRQLVPLLVDAIYDPSPAAVEAHAHFYVAGHCGLLDPDTRDEVKKLLTLVSQLPFVLSLDAEIW
jgi:hypothetical protein